MVAWLTNIWTLHFIIFEVAVFLPFLEYSAIYFGQTPLFSTVM